MSATPPQPEDARPTGLLLDVPLKTIATRDVSISVRRLEGRIVPHAERWRCIRVEVTSSVFGPDEAELYLARDFCERDERDLSWARDAADNYAATVAEALQLAADHYKREAARWGIPPG